jgi:hypothetical protein
MIDIIKLKKALKDFGEVKRYKIEASLIVVILSNGRKFEVERYTYAVLNEVQ